MLFRSLWGFELGNGIESNIRSIDSLVSGLLNVSMTRLFVEFMRDKKDISPKDIFFKYSKVKKSIDEYIEAGENAKLGKIMTSFITYLTTSRPSWKKEELINIATFFSDVPSDISALFITSIDKFGRTSDEFKYATKLHVSLIDNCEDYKVKFYQQMVDIGKRAKESK